MASQYKMTCDICGCQYEACLSCKDQINLKPWKAHTDTAEHYKIYTILLGYNTGVYTIAETKAKLQNVDLSDKDTFVKEIKEVIDMIMAYEEPVEVEPKKVNPTSQKGKKKTNKTVETEAVDG